MRIVLVLDRSDLAARNDNLERGKDKVAKRLAKLRPNDDIDVYLSSAYRDDIGARWYGPAPSNVRAYEEKLQADVIDAIDAATDSRKVWSM